MAAARRPRVAVRLAAAALCAAALAAAIGPATAARPAVTPVSTTARPAVSAASITGARPAGTRSEVRSGGPARLVPALAVPRALDLPHQPGTRQAPGRRTALPLDDLRRSARQAEAHLRRPGRPPAVVAHRGASTSAPENTLLAQDIARQAGADWIENDVQPSADGVPFVLHDGTVDRTTDGTGPVRALTFAQLKALDAGSWFGPHFAGTRLPTLAEQLTDLRRRGGRLLLEIKGRHTYDQVAAIVQVIRDQRMTGRVYLQSFDVQTLRHVHDLAPELPIGLLRATLDADPVALAQRLHLTSYHPSGRALLTRPDLVDDLHRAGVAVMVWTVDTTPQWRTFDELGVDAIITNRPAELAGWLATR